jgi:chromosome segregation ATPase
MYTEETKPVRLKIETIKFLKTIKVTNRYKTYDDLILSAVKILSNSEITGEKSKADILLKNDYDLSKRQEQFFKRLGALETKYFKNILNISESLKELNFKNSKGKEDLEVYKKELNKLMNENSELIKNNKYNESQINHLDSLVDKKQNIISALQKKIVKSSGVFSSGYEMKLSEAEYNEIFESS